MKSYKNKQGEKFNAEINKIRFILESRLQLQSVQRYLDGYNIPRRNFEYFVSRPFIQQHFMKWEPFKQKNFLIKMVGMTYWARMKEMLEKEME